MKNLSFTLKAWPVITLVTIGLCFLTQQGAKLLGIELQPQESLDIVRKYAGFNKVFFFLLAQVLLLAPALEEFCFRYLLHRLPIRCLSARLTRPALIRRLDLSVALVSSVLFSAAHYLMMKWPNDAFLALFFFGLAQCWLYRKTDRIWCPMLNHFLFNSTNLALLFLVPA